MIFFKNIQGFCREPWSPSKHGELYKEPWFSSKHGKFIKNHDLLQNMEILYKTIIFFKKWAFCREPWFSICNKSLIKSHSYSYFQILSNLAYSKANLETFNKPFIQQSNCSSPLALREVLSKSQQYTSQAFNQLGTRACTSSKSPSKSPDLSENRGKKGTKTKEILQSSEWKLETALDPVLVNRGKKGSKIKSTLKVKTRNGTLSQVKSIKSWAHIYQKSSFDKARTKTSNIGM